MTKHGRDIFSDRAQGAFLGLALGDAFGRPLEFKTGDVVRTVPVHISPDTFMWTDDTHMAIYLAKAVLDLTTGAPSEDELGDAIGKRFLEWFVDPLTPSTAPGGTCKSSMKNYKRCGDWKTSGDVNSDGCGAVMRIVPLPLAFDREDLTRAAEVSARITHGHPNALEAAIAASHMLRWTIEEGHFGADLVQRAIAELQTAWNRAGIVAEALEAAIAFSRRS
ncbi:MAG: hypothetical protein GX616_10405, partial [Planctomycetes bacterium]|nr:hypothetical protein [Planctomycetota bacterium]